MQTLRERLEAAKAIANPAFAWFVDHWPEAYATHWRWDDGRHNVARETPARKPSNRSPERRARAKAVLRKAAKLPRLPRMRRLTGKHHPYVVLWQMLLLERDRQRQARRRDRRWLKACRVWRGVRSLPVLLRTPITGPTRAASTFTYRYVDFAELPNVLMQADEPTVYQHSMSAAHMRSNPAYTYRKPRERPGRNLSDPKRNVRLTGAAPTSVAGTSLYDQLCAEADALDAVAA